MDASACVVIVPGEEHVIRAILSAGMIRKYDSSRKILVSISHKVTTSSTLKLSLVFDKIIRNDNETIGDCLKTSEKDLLLISCYKLEQFSKIFALEAGVLALREMDDLLTNGIVMMDENNEWKCVTLTPNKKTYETALTCAKIDNALKSFIITENKNGNQGNTVLYFCDYKYLKASDLFFLEITDEDIRTLCVQQKTDYGTREDQGSLETEIQDIERHLISILTTLETPAETKSGDNIDENQSTPVVGISCRYPPHENIPPVHFLGLSGKTEKELEKLTSMYISYLAGKSDEEIFDIIYTTNVHKPHHDFRRAVVGRKMADLVDNLKTTVTYIPKSPFPRKIAFLFTEITDVVAELEGYASLYRTLPKFKSIMDACDNVCQNTVNFSFLSLLLNSPSENRPVIENQWLLVEFAVYFSTLKLWEYWGVKADVVLGNPLIELVARCASEDLTLEECFKTISDDLIDQNTLAPLNPLQNSTSYVFHAAAGEYREADLKTAVWHGCGYCVYVGSQQFSRMNLDELSTNIPVKLYQLRTDQVKNNKKEWWFQLFSTLANLYESGFGIDWTKFYEPYSQSAQKVNLPHYPL